MRIIIQNFRYTTIIVFLQLTFKHTGYEAVTDTTNWLRCNFEGKIVDVDICFVGKKSLFFVSGIH